MKLMQKEALFFRNIAPEIIGTGVGTALGALSSIQQIENHEELINRELKPEEKRAVIIGNTLGGTYAGVASGFYYRLNRDAARANRKNYKYDASGYRQYTNETNPTRKPRNIEFDLDNLDISDPTTASKNLNSLYEEARNALDNGRISPEQFASIKNKYRKKAMNIQNTNPGTFGYIHSRVISF